MKKIIDSYIPNAVHLIAGEENGKVVIEKINHRISEDGKEVASEFRGYISSFGASIVQAGLLPTLAFYADQEANSAKDRWKILIVLYRLLEHKDYFQIREKDIGEAANFKKKLKQKEDREKLLHLALKFQEDGNEVALRTLKKDIKNAAIALKLALRTYQLTKNKIQNEQ